MAELKDAIDFGKQDIPTLFKKMLLPTVLGMVFSAIFFITDGIFVGRGIGSNALAAVNYVSPLNLISAGLGLMFGTGASIVASIHLSSGKLKVASINMTQAAIFFTLVLGTIATLVLCFPERVMRLFGLTDPNLMALSTEYISGYGWFMVINGFLLMGGFFLRFNGVPKFAMMCSIVSAVLNIILDYLFIFPLGMGIFGAALATGLGTTAGVVMMISFLLRKNTKVRFVKIKLSKKSFKLSARNIGYMSKLGVSSFLGHFSVACMIMSGNMVFYRLMGPDGVAASSILGYISPLVFAIYNSISMAAQPIMSYNFGAGDASRVRKTLKLALGTGIGYGIFAIAVIHIFRSGIVSMFISPTDPAYELAYYGIQFYTLALIPGAINIISMGYFQSVKQAVNANIITLMRGYVLMIGCYATIPLLLGNTGAWLSTPMAEILTSVVVVILFTLNRFRGRNKAKLA